MASGAELQDSQGTNAKILQLLPYYVLGHLSAHILLDQTYTEREGVKTLTLAPIQGSQCADCRSEAISES